MPERRDVRPITQLKNRTADLVREVSEEGRPITITQNGVAKVVVMDVETRNWMPPTQDIQIHAAEGPAPGG